MCLVLLNDCGESNLGCLVVNSFLSFVSFHNVFSISFVTRYLGI